MSEKIEDILLYWFSSATQDSALSASRGKLWYGGKANDTNIYNQYSSLLHAAETGQLNTWSLTARGALALVILLDQFSRNVYRGSAKAFQNDALALTIANDAINKTQDLSLHPIERVFLYHPFEHSESLSTQKRSIALFKNLVEACDTTELRPWFKQLTSFSNYAQMHYEIIEQFGRYPHRNKVLHRQSTTNEISYLRSGGQRFGQ